MNGKYTRHGDGMPTYTVSNVQPGDLVARRLKWNVRATEVGVALGLVDEELDEWYVMWSTGDSSYTLDTHIGDALMIINDPEQLREVRSRCNLVF